jgi:hypothetical protein
LHIPVTGDRYDPAHSSAGFDEVAPADLNDRGRNGHPMPLWTVSWQKRIGVFTPDRRRLENAIVCLNELERLLKTFLRNPYRIDEYQIVKLITVHAETARTQAVAASGKPTILSALQELASQKEK